MAQSHQPQHPSAQRRQGFPRWLLLVPVALFGLCVVFVASVETEAELQEREADLVEKLEAADASKKPEIEAELTEVREKLAAREERREAREAEKAAAEKAEAEAKAAAENEILEDPRYVLALKVKDASCSPEATLQSAQKALADLEAEDARVNKLPPASEAVQARVDALWAEAEKCTPPNEVTAREILRAYKKNETEAERTWRGQPIILTGVVATPASDSNPVVRIGDGRGARRTAQCRAQGDEAKRLRKGQEIRVSGKIGAHGKDGIELENCEFTGLSP